MVRSVGYAAGPLSRAQTLTSRTSKGTRGFILLSCWETAQLHLTRDSPFFLALAFILISTLGHYRKILQIPGIGLTKRSVDRVAMGSRSGRTGEPSKGSDSLLGVVAQPVKLVVFSKAR